MFATASVAAKYQTGYSNSNRWREQGKITDEYVGCHFSWCMDVDAMLHKLETYGHPKYRFCAKRDLLEDAIENKTYPFNDRTQFNIRELDPNDQIIPESLRMGLK